MPVNIIIGVVVLGFVILVMTGLGILTTAVFKIEEQINIIKIQNAGVIDYIKKRTIDKEYTEEIRQKELNELPKDIDEKQKTGNYLIELQGSNLAVAKISLIVFWVLIVIGIIAFAFLR